MTEPEPRLLSWPAPERNKQPILEVLERLSLSGVVLELASGTGQHAVHFAAGLPHTTWQPSEADPELLRVIAARATVSGLGNIRKPLFIDVTQPVWPVNQVDAMFCANMVHISPWQVTEGLFAGAKRFLAPGSLLVTYGPYKEHNVHTSVSNADFDNSLKARDASWGVRDIDDLKDCASKAGMELVERVKMPANNMILVWRRC